MVENIEQPIHDAATVVLLRGTGARAQVLMGQRGAKAVFMPDKFVFPGGRVDNADKNFPFRIGFSTMCRHRLTVDAESNMPEALGIAAIRELWEETGLILGQKAPATGSVPDDWQNFVAKGVVPDCSALTYFFRAVTPPGRPRRFDARFFFANAAAIHGDIDDFSEASGELKHLRWISLKEARDLPLPFVTELVLAEIEEILGEDGAPRPVPYFKHGASGGEFQTIT